MIMVIAVDFDGTLADTDSTKIYSANKKLITYLKQRQEDGDKLILWTCRDGERLSKAVSWCREYGLEFDAVNDNLPAYKVLGLNPRKVFANKYIGDDCCDLKEFDLPYIGK